MTAVPSTTAGTPSPALDPTALTNLKIKAAEEATKWANHFVRDASKRADAIVELVILTLTSMDADLSTITEANAKLDEDGITTLVHKHFQKVSLNFQHKLAADAQKAGAAALANAAASFSAFTGSLSGLFGGASAPTASAPAAPAPSPAPAPSASAPVAALKPAKPAASAAVNASAAPVPTAAPAPLATVTHVKPRTVEELAADRVRKVLATVSAKDQSELAIYGPPFAGFVAKKLVEELNRRYNDSEKQIMALGDAELVGVLEAVIRTNYGFLVPMIPSFNKKPAAASAPALARAPSTGAAASAAARAAAPAQAPATGAIIPPAFPIALAPFDWSAPLPALPAASVSMDPPARVKGETLEQFVGKTIKHWVDNNFIDFRDDDKPLIIAQVVSASLDSIRQQARQLSELFGQSNAKADDDSAALNLMDDEELRGFVGRKYGAVKTAYLEAAAKKVAAPAPAPAFPRAFSSGSSPYGMPAAPMSGWQAMPKGPAPAAAPVAPRAPSGSAQAAANPMAAAVAAANPMAAATAGAAAAAAPAARPKAKSPLETLVEGEARKLCTNWFTRYGRQHAGNQVLIDMFIAEVSPAMFASLKEMVGMADASNDDAAKAVMALGDASIIEIVGQVYFGMAPRGIDIIRFVDPTFTL